ncbi:Dual specificity phosphatase [Globisporangium polare]
MSVGDERKNKSTRPEGPLSRAVEVEHVVETPVSQPIVAMPKRHVRTGRVNCRWLYNQVQAARGLILIDARPREAFEEDTIPSAISIPPMTDCMTLDDVEKGMLAEQRYLFTVKRRKLRDVVLFGETVKSKNSRDPMRADESENSWLRHLERLIVNDGLVTSVKSLFDGFMTFRYRYPFYTTSAMLDEIAFGLTRTRSGTHNLNYPNEILEGFLFLGNMWHAQSKQVIQNLGITHVVNASLDVENVFANEGVQYKAVKIKDRPESDISAFFDSTFEFIESAKRTYHGRVLVHCTQGISRSATLVIMYLMRANNWSLVTAVNFAMASRGVVYPNEGFFKSLMAEEFRLYKGNSITLDEVDLLLQHQIPDRPVPLQIRNRKSENCSQCSKIFSLLEWKHKCSYCRKEFCSKCTSTRLANPEREKLITGLEEQRKPRRVCDVCVSRLWKINLPRPRMGLQMRNAKCKHLNVNSLSTFGKPVCISYFEGTEPQVILDVIKTRFEVKSSQIVDISTEIGEAVRNVADLPDEAVVLVSIGKAGNVQDSSQRGKSRGRYQTQNPTISPRERVIRTRFSSEGNAETLNEQTVKQTPGNIRRTNSVQLDQLAAAVEQNDSKFRDMWKLSFPTMGVIERQALLKIRNPAILMDVMLGVSSLSCGAITIQDFNRRLVELGYPDVDRELVVALLDKSRRANGITMC